jgi:hypothetical protein
MQPETKTKERWIELCEQAAVEQDHDRLMALISEIDRLLCEKEKRPLQFDTTESSTMSAVSGEEKPDAFQPNRAPKAHEKHLGK